MKTPTTAREAWILEALDEVAELLDRVESLDSSLETTRLALVSANGQLTVRLDAFEVGMSNVTQHAKKAAVEHIARSTHQATRASIELQAQAMSEAARTAFTEQSNATLARLVAAVQQLAGRVDRPWEVWVTHVATALASAVMTWVVTSSFASR